MITIGQIPKKLQNFFKPVKKQVSEHIYNYFWSMVLSICISHGSTIDRLVELSGLPVSKFIEAVNAEGAELGRETNFPLHLHPVFNEVDVYGDGKPTRVAFAQRDVRQVTGKLKVSENLVECALFQALFPGENRRIC